MTWVGWAADSKPIVLFEPAFGPWPAAQRLGPAIQLSSVFIFLDARIRSRSEWTIIG